MRVNLRGNFMTHSQCTSPRHSTGIYVRSLLRVRNIFEQRANCWGIDERGEGGWEVQTSSYRMNEPRAWRGRHREQSLVLNSVLSWWMGATLELSATSHMKRLNHCVIPLKLMSHCVSAVFHVLFFFKKKLVFHRMNCSLCCAFSDLLVFFTTPLATQFYNLGDFTQCFLQFSCCHWCGVIMCKVLILLHEVTVARE